MKTIQELKKECELAILDWWNWDMNDKDGFKEAGKRMDAAKLALENAIKESK